MVGVAVAVVPKPVAFSVTRHCTLSTVIKSFRHKGLERFFATGSTRGVNAQHAARLRRLLLALHTASEPDQMNLPGFRLHPPRGERTGQLAVSVSGNWRLVRESDGVDAVDVDLVDYH